jgi:hypothetical protein
MVFPSEIRNQRNRTQPAMVVKPKMRARKIKSGVNWQGALKHKRVEEKGRKSRVVLINFEVLQSNQSSNLQYYFLEVAELKLRKTSKSPPPGRDLNTIPPD